MPDLLVSQPSNNMMDMDDEISLRECWQIITRYKWSIAGLVFIFVLIATLNVFSIKPIYQSTATLLIENQQANVVSIEKVYDLDGGSKQYYETQFGILRSRELAEHVINKLNLLNHAKHPPEKVGFSLNPKNWIPEDLLDSYFPTKVRTEAERQESLFVARLASFQANLSISPVLGSQLVNISYMASDRKLAALVANAIGDEYIARDLEVRRQMTTKATEWLTGQLVGLRQNLDVSEKALQAYRDKEQLIEISGVGTVTADHLKYLNSGLAQAKQREAVAQASYAEVKRLQGKSVEHLFSVPAVLTDSLASSLKSQVILAKRELSKHKKRYGSKHPTMIQAIADYDEAESNFRDRVQAVIASVKKDYQAAAAQTDSMQRSISSTKDEMRQINRKGYKLNVLEREVESNKQLYALFLERFKETNEASGLQSVNTYIVDPAVAATKPIKPKKLYTTVLAGVIGLLLGVILAFFREYLSNTVKTADDLEDKLHLPVLGILPQLNLKAEKLKTPLQFMQRKPHSFFSESIRTIRTSLLLSGLGDPHQIIVVASSVPGEGKSTVSMNIAYSLAEMGRVLLIDADMHRPIIAKATGLSKSHAGLSELVVDTTTLKNCVHKLKGSNVYVMPAGTIPSNPLEILSSQRFVQVLERLNKEFAQIIIDSTPVLAVSDSLVLSTHASGVIYVVKADATSHPKVQEGIKRLNRSGVHIIGAVLNNVVAPKGSKSEYGKYGYYGPYGYTSDG